MRSMLRARPRTLSPCPSLALSSESTSVQSSSSVVRTTSSALCMNEYTRDQRSKATSFRVGGRGRQAWTKEYLGLSLLSRHSSKWAWLSAVSQSVSQSVCLASLCGFREMLSLSPSLSLPLPLPSLFHFSSYFCSIIHLCANRGSAARGKTQPGSNGSWRLAAKAAGVSE